MAASFKKSSDNASRLIFAAGSRGNFVFDLQMLEGQLRLFSNADVEAGRAIGQQKRAYVRQFDMISDNFVSMLSNEKVAKWHKCTNKLEMAEIEKYLKETQLRALPVVLRLPELVYDVVPDPSGKKGYLYFAVERQRIFVVNEQTGNEHRVVHQKALCENDCLVDPFLTYETKDGKINKLQLHYFENYYDYQGRLKHSTYNIFQLHTDFIRMLIECQEIFPSQKHELI